VPTAFITAPPDAAAEIARTLVDERLAACVNRVSCQSTYRWDGEIHDDEEELLLAKTTDDAFEELATRVETLHPYDVPCIERFEEADVRPAFAAWRGRAGDGAGQGPRAPRAASRAATRARELPGAGSAGAGINAAAMAGAPER